jgi:apolipoprotein N-acyltransferase
MFRAILAIFSALLILFSMPGYLWGGLIFVALVPLFFALEGSTPRRGFGLGYLCGFVFFALLLYWVYALARLGRGFDYLWASGVGGAVGAVVGGSLARRMSLCRAIENICG